jgi:ABC-type transport system substrate-binding protein
VPLITGPNQSLNPMFDPFFELDITRTASEGTFDLEPAVISEWSPSSDWKTLSFKVTEGIVAQGPWGEFNAEDVAWVINTYAIDNEVQLGLNWSSIGLQANLSGSHSFTITRTDGNRFTSDFVLGELGQRILVGPLRKQVQAEGLENMAKTAVGTGPFTLERDDPGLRVYERVENHWRVDPAMDELRFLSSPESASRLALVLAGQADVGKTMDEIDVKQATGRGFKTHYTPATTGVYVVFGGANNQAAWGTAPWVPQPNDPAADARALKVRQAVAYAIDTETMIEQLYEGRANRMTTVYPGVSSSKFPPYEYDPDKAKQLLEEAGYDSDTKITFPNVLSEGGRPRAPQEVEAVSIYLQAIGMNIETTQISGGAFYADWNGEKGIDGHIFAFPFFGFAGAWLTMFQLMTYGIFSLYSDATIGGFYGQMVEAQDIDAAEYTRVEEQAFRHVYDNYFVIPLYLTGSTDILSKDFIDWELPGYLHQSQRFDRLRFTP